ncbi:hypothetical protein HYN59_07650 [Flavobacterium album]|uniref:Thioredoxin domain-containing protein n=1 Tax=Flavobacterium album TaxID=2175091 RepID=A0A2S1QX64_9FLAO|nr:TlpA disulfide reductase family protein [Flavobacterium album]AWH85007.1 hypothetical protein HYN59_07650 [Flavobacterium album]
MRQLLLFALLITGSASFAQDYPFLTASNKRSNMTDYVDYLNTLPVAKRDSIIRFTKYYKENGMLSNKAYSDSLFHSAGGFKYQTLIYKDTLTNEYSYIFHRQTEAEITANNEHWKKQQKDDEENRKNLLGSVIDELSLTDMDGKEHTLESLKGKIIVLDFWFVNCGACIEDMPELNKLRQEYGTDDIAWFGITFDKKDKVAKFSEKVKFDFTLIPDGRHLVDRFAIKYFPTTFIIDSDREVIFTGKTLVGNRIGETAKALKKAVKAMEKKRRNSPRK